MKLLNNSVLIIGVVHMLSGFVFHWKVLKDIAGSKLINSIDGHPDRGEVFWYFMAGFMVIASGLLINNFIQATSKPVPASIGVILLLMSITGIILMPASGFWLFLPQGFFIVITASKRKVPGRGE